jgi:sulfatase maturation enzyme AslB (radical SAM superfamily)
MNNLPRYFQRPIKALVRRFLKKIGYAAIPADMDYHDVNAYQQTVADLKSFRKAAEQELRDLKDGIKTQKDEASYLRNYLEASVQMIDSSGVSHPIIENDPALAEEHRQWSSYNLSPPDRSREYASCQWIEGGLSFQPGKLSVCPNSHIGGGTPGLFQFSGGRFSIRDTLIIRKLIIQVNQNGRFEACKSCSFLERKKWPSKKHLFDTICLSHFTTCNLFCDYCYATPEERQYAPLSSVMGLRPTFKWLIDNKYLSPETMIMWGGGEPTQNKEFETLFEYLSEYGVRSQIYSSGVILSKNLLGAIKKKQATVMISLDAGSKEMFHKIKGRDVFERVVQNVKEYAKADGYGAILKMIIRDDNKHEVKLFVELADECGVKIICYDFLAGQDHISEEIIDAAALMKYEAVKRGIEVNVGKIGVGYNPSDEFEKRIEQSLDKLQVGEQLCIPDIESRAEAVESVG